MVTRSKTERLSNKSNTVRNTFDNIYALTLFSSMNAHIVSRK